MIHHMVHTGSRSARRRRDKSSFFSKKLLPYQVLNSGRSFKATIIPAQQSFKLRFAGQVHVGTTFAGSSFHMKPVNETMCTRTILSFIWWSVNLGTFSWMMYTLSPSLLNSVLTEKCKQFIQRLPVFLQTKNCADRHCLPTAGDYTYWNKLPTIFAK